MATTEQPNNQTSEQQVAEPLQWLAFMCCGACVLIPVLASGRICSLKETTRAALLPYFSTLSKASLAHSESAQLGNDAQARTDRPNGRPHIEV